MLSGFARPFYYGFAGLTTIAGGYLGYSVGNEVQDKYQQRLERLEQIKRVQAEMQSQAHVFEKIIQSQVYMIPQNKQSQPVAPPATQQQSVSEKPKHNVESHGQGPQLILREDAGIFIPDQWNTEPSKAVEYLDKSLTTHFQNKMIDDRDVKKYFLNFLSLQVKLDKLNKSISEGIIEHQEYIDKLLSNFERCRFPTTPSFDSLTSELKDFNYNLLPYGAPLARGPKESPIKVNDVDAVLDTLTEHLERRIIPKLKDVNRKIETRQIWANLLAEQEYQIEYLDQSKNWMQSLLKGELEDVQNIIDSSVKFQSEKMTKLRAKSELDAENKIVRKLLEVQSDKHRQVFTDLKQTVNNKVIEFEQQPFALHYAQQLRQLQGVLTNELLDPVASKQDTPVSEALKILRLENDSFVKRISSVRGGVELVSMRDLITSYTGAVKHDALFNTILVSQAAPANVHSLQNYAFAKMKSLFKESVIGDFSKEFVHSQLIEDKKTRVIAELDFAEQSLKAGDLQDCLERLESVSSVTQHRLESTLLDNWLSQARTRLLKEQNLKTLKAYTDKLIEHHKQQVKVQN